MSEHPSEYSEQTYDKRTRRTAMIVSGAFHLGLLLLTMLVTCSSPTEQEDLTEIVWGGSGGSPDVDAPAGPAQRGNPSVQRQQPKPVPTTPEPKKIDVPKTTSPSTETVSPTTEKPKPARPSTEETPRPSSSEAEQGGQRPDGTGTRPAGGTGGTTSGYSVNGLGNRGWIRSPRASYPQGADASGEVVLSFTVTPSGEVTNVKPVKRANQALVNAATAGLRRARARPLPSSVPQIPQQGTITYTFRLEN